MRRHPRALLIAAFLMGLAGAAFAQGFGLGMGFDDTRGRGGTGSAVASTNCLLISGATTNCLLISGTTTNALLIK